MIRVLAIILLFMGVQAQAETIRVAVTTSFHNSGLSDVLLPQIKADTGLDVQLLVVGTGQAIRLGEAGDVDAILVHSRKAEIAFVANGFGTHRREIMYNDFVFIGPSNDPAKLAVATTSSDALQGIFDTKSVFVSRGDDSGTHKKELSLWASAKLPTNGFGTWYRSVGAGMGASLNTASAMDAYILADRASWLNFGNKGELRLLFEGDPGLINQYAYLPVDPARHAHVNANGALRLEQWLVSEHAKSLINGYRINGEPLFVFNAVP